jgi:hypothetical protein
MTDSGVIIGLDMAVSTVPNGLALAARGATPARGGCADRRGPRPHSWIILACRPGDSHRPTLARRCAADLQSRKVTEGIRKNARRAAFLLAYLRLVSCYGCGAERVDLRGVAGGVVTLSLPAGRACRLAVGRQDGQESADQGRSWRCCLPVSGLSCGSWRRGAAACHGAGRGRLTGPGRPLRLSGPWDLLAAWHPASHLRPAQMTGRLTSAAVVLDWHVRGVAAWLIGRDGQLGVTSRAWPLALATIWPLSLMPVAYMICGYPAGIRLLRFCTVPPE